MKILKLPENVKYIIHRLNGSGFPAYAVGGCVRDSLLMRTPADWDVTTSALPNDIMRVFKGCKIIPTGIKHGTVTVIIGRKHYEITTYRVDGEYSDGRRPDQVKFTDNIREDLSRRDFTVNAMAYNDREGLVDCFGGLFDLENNIIRCVGRADERFLDDYLRMLRAFRFAAVLDFDVDGDILDSVRRNKEKLLNISAERIRSEFDKLIVSEHFSKIRLFLSELGGVIFPELEKLKVTPQINKYHCYNVYEHTLQVIFNTKPDLLMRLCALFHDMGKPDTLKIDEDGTTHFKGHASKSAEITLSIMKRLKYDNASIDFVTTIVREHNFDTKKSEEELKYMISRIGSSMAQKLLEFAEADTKGKSQYAIAEKLPPLKEAKILLENIIASNEPCRIKDLALNGSDVMRSLNIGGGKEVGNALAFLLDAVIKNPSKNTRVQLTDILLNNFRYKDPFC